MNYKVLQKVYLYESIARFYLERETLTAELQRLLNFQSNLILANEPELIGFSVMYPKQIINLRYSQPVRTEKIRS